MTHSDLIVTTSLSASAERTLRAQLFADELGCPYFPRNHNTLPELYEQHNVNRCLIVEGGELSLNHLDGTVYRYHPNMGFVRSLNVLRGQRDLFAEAADLRPSENVLDCTLGFASEAMISSLLVGETGSVVGLESTPELALVTREGLRHLTLVQPKLVEAMRRIEVIHSDYRDFLQYQKPGGFDLIYFDPFFHERIDGSQASINPLFRFGNPAPLDIGSVVKAMSLASRRVLVKHPSRVELPPELVERRARVVGARKRAVVYSVFDGLAGR